MVKVVLFVVSAPNLLFHFSLGLWLGPKQGKIEKILFAEIIVKTCSLPPYVQLTSIII
jgi:hypothetical protein